MDDFLKLWKEFVIGTTSLNYHRRKGRTPFYEKERERFTKRIVEPMDAAWRQLGLADRAAFSERPKWI